jgi:hypothetical protein
MLRTLITHSHQLPRLALIRRPMNHGIRFQSTQTNTKLTVGDGYTIIGIAVGTYGFVEGLNQYVSKDMPLAETVISTVACMAMAIGIGGCWPISLCVMAKKRYGK